MKTSSSSLLLPLPHDQRLPLPSAWRHHRCAASESNTLPPTSNPPPTKPASIWTQNLVQRWITGLSLGAIGTVWIASGNGIFTLGFLVASLIAQNEYYAMVRATGVNPAVKIGTLASLACYLTAAMCPAFHELALPLFSTLLMMWLLVFNKKSASISEISTSLLGMFYIGYLPSFWVRLRGLETLSNIRFSDTLRKFLSQRWYDPDAWTLGAIVTWWTWAAIVFSDIGAYFVGRRFGKHKLSSLSAAAGAASPNKTVEGAVGGWASCTLVALLGAYLLQWPLWPITGTMYGSMLSLIALVGDLTASMMKRDAKMKDSGSLLPGHGGLLDRVDSLMFCAPFAFFFCRDVLPLALQVATRLRR
eukprot:gene6630-7323_t